MSSCGLIEKNIELSHIHLAVQNPCFQVVFSAFEITFMIYLVPM